MLLALLELPLVVGFALAWSLAAPPGPANALIAQEAARRGFAAGWWTGLGAVTGDVMMFLLMWWGVLRVVGAVRIAPLVLATIGAALMLKFAIDAVRAARAGPPQAKGRGSFGKSFVTVVTSPFNWGWWLTAGTSLFSDLGFVVMVGFFAGLLAWIVAWSGLARMGASRLDRFAEIVGYAAAVVLVAFALLLGWFAFGEARDLLA